MSASEVLEQVAGEVAVCTRCDLHHSRRKAVPGEGPANAQIMLIGEGPGFHENEQGRPFVGAAGKFLEELLTSVGLRREDVFITNVVKCRPPQNRDPLPPELEACTRTYLARQILAINPRLIVTLGRFSMNLFIPGVKISHVHGRPTWVKGRMVVPMYHPAAALHQASLKPELEKDFARLPDWIEQAAKAAAASPESAAGGGKAQAAAVDLAEEARLDEVLDVEKPQKPEPKQLSLF
jgi:uracil-DNA glycosylase